MYSLDIRNAAVHMKLNKYRSFRYIANELGSPTKSTIQRWVAQHPVAGPVIKRLRGRISKLHCQTTRHVIDTCIENNPFMTAEQLQHHLANSYNIIASAKTVSSWRRTLGFSQKRSITAIINNPKVTAQRNAFATNLQPDDAWQDVVSIDETAVYKKVRKLVGFSRIGKRLVINYDSGCCERFTMIMAVSCSGIVAYQLINGACNSELFADFIAKLPVAPSTRLLLDNLSSHKTKLVHKVAQDRNITLMFLPPYTPQWQPIEYVFSRFKQLYRCLALSDRSQSIEDIVLGAVAFLDSAAFEGSYAPTFDHCRRLALANVVTGSHSFQME